MIKKLFKRTLFIFELAQKHLTNKQFIFLSSVIVGGTVGLAAIILKVFVHLIYITAINSELGHLKYFYLALPFIGILLTVLIISKVFKDKFEKGLAQIHFRIAKDSSNIPKEQAFNQIITSSLTVGLGGSAGLEAPIVVTGAAFGSNYAKLFKLKYADRTLLLACGIAASIGAMFNAPIAGVLFALEVLLIDMSISAFIPVIIAAATGTLISKIILQDNILLSFTLQQPFNYNNVFFYIMLGVLSGVVSVYHARIFSKIEGLFHKSKNNGLVKVVIGGILLAILIFIFPTLFGEGYQSIKNISLQHPELILHNSLFEEYKNKEWFVLMFIGILIFVKAIATGLTIGSGGNGGNFAPSLFVGAYLGYFFAKIINKLDISSLPESNFTIVGMAGILSGIYHAPLTAIFLIAEITGGYTLIIPLMIVSSLGYVISKYFEPHSMDTKNLALSGNIFTADKDHNILTTINTESLIEYNFETVKPYDTLGSLVNIITLSEKNIFPVTDINDKLLGIILLEDVKKIIFKTELYNKVKLKEIMLPPIECINFEENMESVMIKFEKTNTWYLPVLKSNKFVGFISKSKIFKDYRKQLKMTTIS